MLWSSASAVCVVLCAAASSAASDLPWWKTAILYQIYPYSFRDSDGDGVGDLRGITEAADYLKEVGVDAVWLSPIYPSPMADCGYDVSDFTAVDPLLGTMDDFDDLLEKLRDLDIKLLLDFVPNHTSDQHVWFQQSLNKSNPDYLDFYVWMDPKARHSDGSPIPPNNWLSMFGDGSAWQWREERQQFYYHQFTKHQPDLNFRNPNVRRNVTEALTFWLDKGVDGFRMAAVKHYFENGSFPDEPPVPGTTGDTFASLQHIYELNQPETLELVRHWANVVYERVLEDGRQRAVFLEVYDTIPTSMQYYGSHNDRLTLQAPFNFNLMMSCNQSSRSTIFKTLIDNWMAGMPSGAAANWVVGNHDYRRAADRYGPEMVDAMNLLTGVLPGVKVTYNGEEIGMQDTFVRQDQARDPTIFSRDPYRTPMQWDNTTSAGFSTNLTTWLPVNPNYWWLNVEAQKAAETSHLKVFQAMSKARKDPVLQKGDLNVLAPDNDTLVVVRHYSDNYFVLVINMGSSIASCTSQNLFKPNNLDIDMRVVASSINCGYTAGTSLKRGSANLTLRPKAAVLLRSSSDAHRPRLASLLVAFPVLVLLVTSR